LGVNDFASLEDLLVSEGEEADFGEVEDDDKEKGDLKVAGEVDFELELPPFDFFGWSTRESFRGEVLLEEVAFLLPPENDVYSSAPVNLPKYFISVSLEDIFWLDAFFL